MKISLIAAAFVLCLALAPAYSDPLGSVKITPEGVDYPMVRTKLYPHKKERMPPTRETFETIFGVRRWLGTTSMEADLLQRTLEESMEWNQRYAGYGVLGHGEEVLTPEAAVFRKSTLLR